MINYDRQAVLHCLNMASELKTWWNGNLPIHNKNLYRVWLLKARQMRLNISASNKPLKQI